MRLGHPLLVAGIALTGSFGLNFGFAGEAPPLIPPLPPVPSPEPDGVTVILPGREAVLMDTPASVAIVPKERLHTSRSLPQALEETPGISVQKTSIGQGSPYIRGFTGFRNLMLIDGIRLNNAVFREGPNQYWNTVDAWSVRAIEVARGPMATEWGSDAVGGVAMVRTKTEAAAEGPWKVGGSAWVRYGSADQSMAGRTEFHGSGDDLGVFLGATARRFGDTRAGREVGLQRDTGYDEISTDAKMEWRPADKVQVTAAVQHLSQFAVPRTHSTTSGISWEGTALGTDRRRNLDQDRTLAYVQIRAQKLESFVDEIHASASFHRQAEAEDRVRSGSDRRMSGVSDDQWGTFVHLTSLTPQVRFTYGFDAYRDYVNSFEDRYNASGVFTGAQIQGPVADDATYDLLGVFVQAEADVIENTTILSGLRFTYAHAQADKVINPSTSGPAVLQIGDEWTSIDGSLRAQYRPAKAWAVWAGASSAFRAPNLSDLTRLDIALSGELETPSPNLDPERFITFESGVRYGDDRFSVSASGYYTFIHDMIVRYRTGQIVDGANEVQKANIGDGFVTGLELDVRATVIPSWTVFGGFGYSYGEVRSLTNPPAPALIDEPLAKSQPFSGLIGVRWDNAEKSQWVELVGKGALKADRLSTLDRNDTSRIPPGGTPGFFFVTARGGLKLTDSLSLTVEVENILDEDFRYHGSGSNEPGTNFVLQIEADF